MSDRLIRNVQVSSTAPQILGAAPSEHSFVAAFAPAPRGGSSLSFPRNWSQLEELIETRLAEFELRHREESQEGFQRGIQEGRREQVADLDMRLAQASEPWRALQDAVRRELASYREELYRGTTELASALARAWLGSMVEMNPHVFEVGLRKALEALGHQEHIEVRLHPDDYEAFRQGLSDRDQTLWDAPEVNVTPDPTVDRGGAVAEASGGTADARLAVRVQKALEWLNLHDSN